MSMLSPMRLANDYDINVTTGRIYLKDTWQLRFNRISKKGYLCETINTVTHYAHHIIYFWATGDNPRYIKHIDKDKFNNCFENLYVLQEIKETKETKYTDNKLSNSNLISYYENEIPNLVSKMTPSPKIIIDENYTTFRTKTGNWSLKYKDKHICYQPSYDKILKYIQKLKI